MFQYSARIKMRALPFFVTALSVLLVFGSMIIAEPAHQAEHDQPPKPHSPASAYQDVEIQGWKLKIHSDLIADAELYKQTRDEIDYQLFGITRLLPKDRVVLLRKVSIWVELKNPYSDTCQYHTSKDWLIENGFLAEKAKCVEISSAQRFIRISRKDQPCVLLHELSHAYHDQVLGADDQRLLEAFKNAKASGKYDRVLHINGREVRHYALTNPQEYFAECTEAFLATNDFYPYVRSELREVDPDMSKLLSEIWGVNH